MRFTYSPSVDAFAIELIEGATSARMRRLTQDVNADFDASGRLVTIEIVNFSHHYPEVDLTGIGETTPNSM